MGSASYFFCRVRLELWLTFLSLGNAVKPMVPTMEDITGGGRSCVAQHFDKLGTH